MVPAVIDHDKHLDIIELICVLGFSFISAEG